MKKIIKVLFVALICFAAIGSVEAQQKVGYINMAQLIDGLPSAKQAATNLQNLQERMTKELQSKEQAWQTQFEAAQKEAMNGTLSPQQQQQKEQYLQGEYGKLEEEAKRIQQDIGKKREDLLNPILEKIQNAIEQVAKEKGYNVILDSSNGDILFGEESENILPFVKAIIN